MDGWIEYEGKMVYVQLRNGRKYSGKVLGFDGDMVLILDKYDKKVRLRKEDISIFEEENNASKKI